MRLGSDPRPSKGILRSMRAFGPNLFPAAQTSAESRGWRDLRRDYMEETCFYASPIGKPGSEPRRHADLFLESLVRPAMKEVDPSLKVIRADELAASSITASIMDHVAHARLLIADLSFHNPNVLYEVGRRHAHRMPFVLITRTNDSIPSNLTDSRVVLVNMDTVPTFVAEMEARRAEIAEHARWALSPEGEEYFRR